MKHVLTIVLGVFALTACLGDEVVEDFNAPCEDNEIHFEDEDGEGFCEVESDSSDLEAAVNTGTRYVGYRLGYRTYMAKNCASKTGACRGHQTRRANPFYRGNSLCYRIQKRGVGRSPTSGSYFPSGNWKNTYVNDCR